MTRAQAWDPSETLSKPAPSVVRDFAEAYLPRHQRPRLRREVGSRVFEHAPVPDGLTAALAGEVHALARIFMVGQRAGFDLVVSPKTVAELAATPDTELRENLVEHGAACLGGGPCPTISQGDLRHARDLARRLDGSPFLSPLRDDGDRELVAHATAFGRDTTAAGTSGPSIGSESGSGRCRSRFVTPMDWWDHLGPWARLRL